jgi:hypothetical protein
LQAPGDLALELLDAQPPVFGEVGTGLAVTLLAGVVERVLELGEGKARRGHGGNFHNGNC